MLELTTERVGSYERESIIYFNAGRDDQVFIVSVHDHKVILEVMKGSSLLIKKELRGFSEDAQFYELFDALEQKGLAESDGIELDWEEEDLPQRFPKLWERFEDNPLF